MLRFSQTTIDGSEIQRSPVDVGSLSHVFSHYLQGFSCIQTVETAKVGISEAKKNRSVVGRSSAPKVKRISGIKAATRPLPDHEGFDVGFGMTMKLSLSLYPPGNGYISHLGGKRKIIFKMPFLGDMLVSGKVFIVTFFGVELGCKLQTF